jgi:hypothetical protein
MVWIGFMSWKAICAFLWLINAVVFNLLIIKSIESDSAEDIIKGCVI